MTLNHVRQEPGSNDCGPACLAMLFGSTIAEMRKMAGKPSAGFSPLDFRRVLAANGIDCPRRVFKSRLVPNPCFIQVADGRRLHWVLYADGLFYDPEADGPSAELLRPEGSCLVGWLPAGSRQK